MYKVLKDLYKDIADLVPKPALLHMGGDEVAIILSVLKLKLLNSIFFFLLSYC